MPLRVSAQSARRSAQSDGDVQCAAHRRSAPELRPAVAALVEGSDDVLAHGGQPSAGAAPATGIAGAPITLRNATAAARRIGAAAVGCARPEEEPVIPARAGTAGGASARARRLLGLALLVVGLLPGMLGAVRPRGRRRRYTVRHPRALRAGDGAVVRVPGAGRVRRPRPAAARRPARPRRPRARLAARRPAGTRPVDTRALRRPEHGRPLPRRAAGGQHRRRPRGRRRAGGAERLRRRRHRRRPRSGRASPAWSAGRARCTARR